MFGTWCLVFGLRSTPEASAASETLAASEALEVPDAPAAIIHVGARQMARTTQCVPQLPEVCLFEGE